MKYRELTDKIINAVYTVHSTLGFGFLEKVYQNALVIELTKRGIKADSEKPINVLYEGQVVGDYVCDVVVDNKVILELKALKELNDIYEVQLVNYLKATGMEVGLLINFGPSVKIKRKVFNHSGGLDKTGQK